VEAITLLQAKSPRSRLVQAIEQGQEREIIIARNDEVARIFLQGEGAAE
jgi:antitoxin (DNA-binding transcriptional repressor) of toxin-antitoxin stability system